MSKLMFAGYNYSVFFLLIQNKSSNFASANANERCSSGSRGTPAKRVTGKTGSGVRIPLSPLFNLKGNQSGSLFVCLLENLLIEC